VTTANDASPFRVSLNGYAMQLRRAELEAVAAGIGRREQASVESGVAFAEALSQLPQNDRAPVWELAVRRYGRNKPLERAAGEIGMDVIRARQLLERYAELLASVTPPESRA
jgi:hypothetical protein